MLVRKVIVKKIAAAAILLKELFRYAVTRHTGEFHEYMKEKLLGKTLPPWSRGIAIALIVNTALNKRSYGAALSDARSFATELPWEEISPELNRKLFEVALIFGDPIVAKHALTAVQRGGRLSDQACAKMELLRQWRFVGLLPKEAEAIDLRDVYFGSFPEYDQYFKGAVTELRGESTRAREHFERALQLAPNNAAELRNSLQQRIERLSIS